MYIIFNVFLYTVVVFLVNGKIKWMNEWMNRRPWAKNSQLRRSVLGCGDCRPAYTFCCFLPLSYRYLFPNFLFSSFLVLVLLFFLLSVSFLSCLVFPSCFHLFLSFFLSCGGVPVPCVPGVPALSGTFLLTFTRMYSYVTRMLLVCTRMWLVCYPYDSQQNPTKLMNSHQKTQEYIKGKSPLFIL